MRKVVLPESLKEIEDCAFNWCRDLEYMRLPESLEVLEEDAIAECLSLRELHIGPNTKMEVWDGLPFTCDNDDCRNTYPDLTICSLPGSDAERFAKEYGFQFATGARGMRAEEQGQCGDDVWWFKSGDTLVLYGTGETWYYDVSDGDREILLEQRIPERVLFSEKPEYYAFHDEIRRAMVLPGVKKLNQAVFGNMNALQEVDLGTIVGCHCALHSCDSLTEVVLPETMKGIDGYNFSHSRNLRRITIENGSSRIDAGLLSGLVSLEEVWFSGKEKIGDVDLFTPDVEEQSEYVVTFYVKEGSDALRYAKEHDIPYEIVK